MVEPKAAQLAKGRASSFSTGMVWNLVSLVFLALAGFGLNVAIGRLYGPEALGVFNICFAGFIFLSQIGSFGLQFSILQAVAEHAGRDQEKVDEAVSSGLVLVCAMALASVVLALALTPLVASWFDAQGITTAWLAMLPGLFAFCLNKYLFGVINGVRHMRTFAVLQAVRYALMLLALAGIALARLEAALLTLVFTVAELALLPMLLWGARRAVVRIDLGGSAPWRAWHLSFGARAFLSGAILELNTRIDVIFIGAMLDAAKAGVYSVALLVAEGAAQLLFVLRNNINPVVTRMLVDRDGARLLAFSRKMGLVAFGLMATASIFAGLAFPFFVDFVMGDQVYHQGLAPLLVLLVGLTLTAGAQSFGMVLALAKKPALHTAFVTTVLLTNIVLNWLLIPKFELFGSALATALSYVVGAVLGIVLTRQSLGFRLFI